MFYMTNPTTADSDGDACPDNEEVADVIGIRGVNSGAQLAMASRLGIVVSGGTIIAPGKGEH